TGEEEPAPKAMPTALRDVMGRCIYGVDLNPMAIELCKINLWMEALEPGKPLSFLDHHIQCGNSLLGTTPELMEGGIPDDAFKPIQGDDKKVCAALRKQNKQERQGQRSLFVTHAETGLGDLAKQFEKLSASDDASLELVKAKAKEYRAAVASASYQHASLVADTWCAAFVWKRDGTALDGVRGLTTDLFRRLEESPGALPDEVRARVAELKNRYRFFHWHLAFPEVFREPELGEKPTSEQGGWSGGFDVVLGNPPWERIKLQEKEFFAARDPEIASAPNAAARRRMIAALKTTNPQLLEAFEQAKREAEGASHLVRRTGLYPLCGRGDVNTYTIFAELMRGLIGPAGRTGCIVPSGIATDDTTKYFFSEMVESGSLHSLYDFQSGPGLFSEIGHARFKFCLLTMLGPDVARPEGAEFAFFLRSTTVLRDPERRFMLSAEDMALLNPNTRTCPVFRTRRDAELTKSIYRRVPVLIKEGPPEENPWGIKFATMFHMSNDSHLFRTREQLEGDGFELEGNVFVMGEERWLPLYEAKMIHHFNHRFGDYAHRPAGSQSTALPEVPVERLQDPSYAPLPKYWVPAEEVEARLAGKWDREWLLGWRDITNATNERTVIAGVMPVAAVGHTCPLLLPNKGNESDRICLVANLGQFVLDYIARQKIGGTHLTYGFLEQFPLLPAATYSEVIPWGSSRSIGSWVQARVLELSCTTATLGALGLNCGYDGPPFGWDEARRFLLRCELDAAYFRLYGIGRDDVDYIMETFPIVKRKDEKAHGEYRTKRVILEIYDEMTEAIRTGEEYETRLDPPAGDARVAHSGAGH
ncbi:MAG: SAM-dependent DNA methyltransferase, partial [Candidatus Eisenbacteria sp.]|nr:SAM-dependent DNA methyltransferase [Candidatus Eisenbacteria bacterium]